jgi:hypothetical protein
VARATSIHYISDQVDANKIDELPIITVTGTLGQ